MLILTCFKQQYVLKVNNPWITIGLWLKDLLTLYREEVAVIIFWVNIVALAADEALAGAKISAPSLSSIIPQPFSHTCSLSSL